MGHFSRYIPRGSTIIDVKVDGAAPAAGNATFACTAAKTPQSDIITVCANTDDSGPIDYQLEIEGLYAQLTIPPHGMHTLIVKHA